jgi:hypothetical protein
MTINEMKNEIISIEAGIMQRQKSEDESKRRLTYYEIKCQEIVKGGYVKFGLPKNAKKAEVENYLAAVINACYDTYGECIFRRIK